MPMDKAMSYHLAMDIITCEEMGRLARATSVHAMTKSGREKYFKDLNKSTKLVIRNKDDKILSVEEAAQSLARTMQFG